MRVYEDAVKLRPGDFVNPVAAVGVFDGLHVGHCRLLSELCRWAGRVDGESVAITFRVHPRAVITRSGPTHITSLKHRLLLLGREGVDACLVLDFTPGLAGMTAGEFSRLFLVERLSAKGLLMGFDTRIGHRGEGTPEQMARIGSRLGFTVRTFPAVEIDGEAVSSTRIRRHILAGELVLAEKMLGRPVTVLGTVVKGEGRGRKLGFPTANLNLHHEARPPTGVYAAFAIFDDSKLPALVSIGSRPTFHPDATGETIEVHIPGFEGDLYGRDMEVRFISKIREQRDFPTPGELVKRMREDARELKRLLSGNSG
jgi:riboflavin kinase/FMN adenylyltransferase